MNSATNHVRKEGCLPQRNPICAHLRFRGKREGGDAILLPSRRREVSAYVMPKAPVGLRRMRELRYCHFSGNFVTETALFIGAVETNTRSAAGVPAGCLSTSRHCNTAVFAKKILQKDFLRRGAASVLSVVFGYAESPAECAPP